MPAANPLYEVIPRHTMFQIGRDLLPSQAVNPLVGIVKREGVLEVLDPGAGLNPPVRLVLHCLVANYGTASFTLACAQSANNESDGVGGGLTPDTYVDVPIRLDGAAVVDGEVVVQAGGRAVFLIEWFEDVADYLRFRAFGAGAVAASGNVDMTGLPTDGDTIILDDGVHPAVTYEFDGDASVTDGPTLQGVTIGASATATIATLIALINTPTAGAVLDITASSGAGDSADLVNDDVGGHGNVAIIDAADNTTVTGMSGGGDGVGAAFGELTLAHYNGTLVPRAREGVN
jgi:hypothetical protein